MTRRSLSPSRTLLIVPTGLPTTTRAGSTERFSASIDHADVMDEMRSLLVVLAVARTDEREGPHGHLGGGGPPPGTGDAHRCRAPVERHLPRQRRQQVAVVRGRRLPPDVPGRAESRESRPSPRE